MGRSPMSGEPRDISDVHRLLGEVSGGVKALQNQIDEQKRDSIRTDDRLTSAVNAVREAQYQQTMNIQRGIDDLKQQIVSLDDKADTQDAKADTVSKKVAVLQDQIEDLKSPMGEIKSWQATAVRYIGFAVAIIVIVWTAVVKPLIEEGIHHFFK